MCGGGGIVKNVTVIGNFHILVFKQDSWKKIDKYKTIGYRWKQQLQRTSGQHTRGGIYRIDRFYIKSNKFLLFIAEGWNQTQMPFNSLSLMTSNIQFVCGFSHMALLWCEAVYMFCSLLFIHTVTGALQSCNLCRCSGTVSLVHSLKLKKGRKGGEKDQMLGISSFFKHTLDAFTCVAGLRLPQINPYFINSHEPDMWKWKTVALCDEVRWQNFICGQFWHYDGILKCQPFFLCKNIYYVQTVILIGSA